MEHVTVLCDISLYKIHAYIDDNMALHLYPRNSLELAGLKYFGKELQTHGLSLIDIETDTTVYKKLKAEHHKDDE